MWHADFLTLKIEAIRSSETSVHTKSKRRHIPDDGILHFHRRETLKSYITLLVRMHIISQYYCELFLNSVYELDFSPI
jgi:hypothetical protein